MSFSSTKAITRIVKTAIPVVTVGLLATACASSGNSASTSAGPAAKPSRATSIIVQDGHLTSSSGRTVYLRTADPAGKSTCAGACAAAWPPVPGTAKAGAGASAGKFTTIKRAGGGSQLVYAGHALYYFANDKSDGQTSGEGLDDFGAKWWALDAAGKAVMKISGNGPSSAPASSSGSGGGYVY